VWILQADAFLEIPEDAPLPPGSKVVEVPHDFDAAPEAYIVTADGVERRAPHELEALRRHDSEDRLTPDDVMVLKRMIKEREQ
jgi:hypothetical protein